MPLEMVVAPTGGRIVGQDDIYFVADPVALASHHGARGLVLGAAGVVRMAGFFRGLLSGLLIAALIGTAASFAAWAIRTGQSEWIIAVAAMVQTLTAVAIVALTRRLADTAVQALWTSGAQTAALFEANLQARVQRETEAMAVLQLDRPKLRKVPPDEIQFTFPVLNTSVYPALSVSLRIGRGPWSWDWNNPPHRWVETHAIQQTDDVGVLPAGGRHDFTVALTREWAATCFTVRVEASGVFGGRLFQTWEMELSQTGVTNWRQLEVYVLPRTPGAEPIQHRTAVG